jgi:hypothetical protein
MKITGPSYFRLEKNYLDCIDEEGNCFIVYQAKLHFLFMKINYSSLLFSDYQNFTTEQASLKKPDDFSKGDSLKFSHSKLNINGTWEKGDNALPAFKMTNSLNHHLVWNCHHPKTPASIIYNGIQYKGFGYADTVFLTIQPGKLQIDELKWGRFHSETNSVTWINISGDFPVNKLFFNGKEYHDAVFGKDLIVFDDGASILKFDINSVIREGKLVNIFSRMSLLRIFFDTRILNAIEIKYKAKSTFSHKDKISDGWSLYETVIWKT